MTTFDPEVTPNAIVIGWPGRQQVITRGGNKHRDENGVHMAASLEGWDEMAAIITSEGGYQKFGNRELLLPNWKVWAPSRAALIQKFREINETVPLTRYGEVNPGVPFAVYREGKCEGHVMVTIPEPIKFPILGKAVGRDRSAVLNGHYTARNPLKLSGSGGFDFSASTALGEAGQIMFGNAGNAGKQPVLIEVTDVTAPTLTLIGTGQTITFPDLTVDADSVLAVDSRNLSVTLNGANVYSEMVGDFFTFHPTTNTVALGGAVGPSGVMTVKTNKAVDL